MSIQIAIADDDPAVLDSTKMILELDGYNVRTASNGAEVCKIYEDPPKLLLLDIWMSGEDGRDICRNLKADTNAKKVPIILISASGDVLQSAKDAGADDFLAKPFEMEKLLSLVKKYTS